MSTWSEIVIDLGKLKDYCLSPVHPVGKHKAKVFRSMLGITAHDAAWLREAIQNAVRTREEELLPTKADAYGQRFILDFPVSTARGTGIVRTAWIVRPGETRLRLVTCHVK